jgi:hypothetical protein
MPLLINESTNCSELSTNRVAASEQLVVLVAQASVNVVSAKKKGACVKPPLLGKQRKIREKLDAIRAIGRLQAIANFALHFAAACGQNFWIILLIVGASLAHIQIYRVDAIG